MNVSQFVKEAGCTVFSEGEDRAIESGYCGDFLSNMLCEFLNEFALSIHIIKIRIS